jgi:hypothetical protein
VAPYNLFIVDHHILVSSVIAVVFMVFVSLPVGCHAFVSPMLACFAEKARLVCTIGTSPLSMRWWVVDACTLFTTPITVSARTCQQWQVPPWPWILRTRQVESRIATYKLHGVAANGLTICACVIVYTMLYVIKSGGIVGGGGTIIKSILTHFTLFIFLIIVK